MSKYLSSGILEHALQNSSKEEFFALLKAVDPKATQPSTLTPKALQGRVCREAGHGLGNWLRSGEGLPYREMLYDACSTLKVSDLPHEYKPLQLGINIVDLDANRSEQAKTMPKTQRQSLVSDYVDRHERMLLSKLLIVVYEKMTPEQRLKFDQQVAAMTVTHVKDIKGLSTSAALLVLGNLGGFATYTLMSTALGALSLGTLGFGAYTFASSALSFVLGPVGWIGLGLYGVIKLGGPNDQKVVQMAATCAMINQRIKSLRPKPHSPEWVSLGEAKKPTEAVDSYVDHNARLADKRAARNAERGTIAVPVVAGAKRIVKAPSTEL